MICREMHWTLDELHALPTDQYDVLLDWLGAEFKARARD